jgi:thioredoxin 1
VLKSSCKKSLFLGLGLLLAASTCFAQPLPRLVDVGAEKCIPCKMMAPILEELKGEYAGRMVVDFVDVWKNPEEAQKYGVQMIPTQIFYNPEGQELFRRNGFIAKADILAKWQELGYDFGK